MKHIFVLLAVFLLSCSGDDEGHPDGEGNGTKGTLKVMSYNIHIANPPSEPGVVDINGIVNVIKEANPDLVALQEVDRFTNRSGNDLDQAKEIAERTGMNYYFAKAMNQDGGEIGQAILSRYPIEASDTHLLPGADGVEAFMRSIGVVRIEMENGQKVIFGATHLDHLTDKSRRAQAREMIIYLRDTYPELPVVVGGDLNMPPTNEIWNLLNTAFTRGCDVVCPGTFPASNARTTIDYLFINKTADSIFEIDDYYTIPETYASDHLPLVMELKFTTDQNKK
ncbi:endonuclease/exonuclease/phosphatase family protein [Sinomicrobium soli]|uniref:endonuclease/exonuclease/phosphatase family protein n=1 Tax=Sinomicrobium sp. N-1-3-6 TaxID=2219864 RepID=UPI000DCB0439|nr:endonuclease/exonuclease/phosphatase family protein [Sinomicrobium sp. N-1-3-6]RAV28429.1 hypothetical protein DN748_13685 [Sinomicrobium sp. N-1-3-6]